MKLEEHPTVKRLEASSPETAPAAQPPPVSSAELRQWALECGAVDAGARRDLASRARSPTRGDPAQLSLDEDALTDDDRAEGYILACQAEINGDVVVDA